MTATKKIWQATYPAMYRPLADQPELPEGVVATVCTAPTFNHAKCQHCGGEKFATFKVA